MTIVACGMGLAGAAVANVLVADIILTLADEPVITLDPEIVITLDIDG